MASFGSRRHFLATVAGTAVAARFASFVQPLLAGEFGPFQMGVQSYTFREFPVDKAIEIMHDLGFKTVEFYNSHYPHTSSDEQIAVMNKKLADKGLKVLSHGVHRFTKDHEKNRKLFDFAKRAGIRNLTADPDEDSFDSLDKLVAEYDVRIAIHNHGPTHRYNKVDDVLRAIKGRNEKIGACADLGHFVRSGEDPVKVITLLEGRLYGIHLKDFDSPQDKAKHSILGQGLVDVAAVFKALKKVDFPPDACLALEYEANPKDPIADVKACLVAAKAGAKKAFGE